MGGQATAMERAVVALQDLTRRDILYRFYADPTPKTAVEVARTAGVHRSVAFDHLERLVALGYLQADRRRGFPGKPAKLYRLAQGPITVSHPPRQFGLLAQQLALALQEFGPAGKAAARDAGRRLAAGLRGSGHSGQPADDLEPLRVLGGSYQRSEEGLIRVDNCLFREACDAAGVVCELHAAAIGRLLEGSGRVEVQALGKSGVSGCGFRIAAGSASEDDRALRDHAS